MYKSLLSLAKLRPCLIVELKALFEVVFNRFFSKMAAENSNKLKLKTYTSTRKSTFTLVTLQSFSISGVISAEKM